MTNPLLLCDLAELHLREVKADVRLKPGTNVFKGKKVPRPGLLSQFISVSEALLQKHLERRSQEPHFPDEHLVLNPRL